ncbi:MAG: DUF4442 domain-containing protein [Planctomycetota bacterium]
MASHRPDGHQSPTRLGPWRMLWMMRLYPPLLFAGVRWQAVASDFRSATVLVKRRLINRNVNGTVFGGAMAAAVDPVMALLYWQAFAHRGRHVEVWTAELRIAFVRPASSDLRFEFQIDATTLEEVEVSLDTDGRARRTDRVVGIDREGTVCAEVELGSALRDPAVLVGLASGDQPRQ